MAEKRMFAKSIVLSDAFLDMPASARALYFTLGMLADDDGFVGAPKSVMRQCSASPDDLTILASKRFIIPFPSGVIVIKHWKINNTLKADRYRQTEYQDELALLQVKPNKAYTEARRVLNSFVGTEVEPEWNRNGTTLEPQNSKGKDSIDKDSLKNVVDARAREADAVPPFGRVMSFLMDKVNPDPSDRIVDSVKYFLEKGLEADVIIHAMSIAIDEKKTSWSYIKAILQRYVRDGLTTMRAVLDEEKRHEAGKGGSYAAGRKEPASAPRGHGPGGSPLPSAIDEY